MTAMSRLAVAGALGLCLAPISASAFTFTDTFGPPSSQWSNSSGSWTASSGQYYATVPNNNPESWSYLPYVFTNVSDQVTVSVNNFGDGGILFLAPNGTDYILNVLGGLGYGQGNHSAPAGTSDYWATSADPAPITAGRTISSPLAMTIPSRSQSRMAFSPCIRGRRSSLNSPTPA